MSLASVNLVRATQHFPALRPMSPDELWGGADVGGSAGASAATVRMQRLAARCGGKVLCSLLRDQFVG